jgi:uncharacterized membrane protein YphA (DoxX/SURF4 family)
MSATNLTADRTAALTGKASKITYWIATLWLSLGMTATGIVQLMRTDDEVQLMASLSYPVYLLSIIGVWKILGVIAVLVPRFPLVKEWAYAGFFIAMSGAIVSHLIVGHGAKELFGPALLLVLTFVSWYFRPASRRLISVNQ